jgi:hypothetical protein
VPSALPARVTQPEATGCNRWTAKKRVTHGKDPKKGIRTRSAVSARFISGDVYSTPGAIERIPANEMSAALVRHLSGDWGDLDQEDKSANERALVRGGRLFSAYSIESGTKFWIITEADRSATTILLPEEY